MAIASEELGNLFVVDAYTIRRITLADVVTTIAGEPGQRGIKLGKTPGRLESAGGVAVIDANTIAVTQGRDVMKIVINATAAAH